MSFRKFFVIDFPIINAPGALHSIDWNCSVDFSIGSWAMANVELDCKGLNCPMPIVRISRAMKELQVGDHLRVEASDPSFQSDIEAWVRKMGHDLKSFEESQGVQKVVLEKRA